MCVSCVKAHINRYSIYLISNRCLQIHFVLLGAALFVKQSLTAKARRQRHRIHVHISLIKASLNRGTAKPTFITLFYLASVRDQRYKIGIILHHRKFVRESIHTRACTHMRRSIFRGISALTISAEQTFKGGRHFLMRETQKRGIADVPL